MKVVAPATDVSVALQPDLADTRFRRGPQTGVSHIVGPIVSRLCEKTIGDVLLDTANVHGPAVALVVPHQGVRLTWAELNQQVDALATGLAMLNLVQGDRVGIWSPNRAEWVVVQLATARIGLILVTINPAYRAFELEHALRLAGCRLLVTASRFKTSDYAGMVAALLPNLSSSTERPPSLTLPQLEYVVSLDGPTIPGAIAYEKLIEQGETGDTSLMKSWAANVVAGDPVNIQFTSGTTGLPKGATLTHRNILNNAMLVGAHMRFTAADRLCLPVPLYHCFDMVMGVLNCIAHGATIVLPGETFDPRDMLSALEAERCTALYGVPTMFVAALSQLDIASFDFSSLRTGVMAGAPCPVEVMSRAIKVMNIDDITICYGMTETSPVSFQTPADADITTRTETVGFVHPHLEAKVIDEQGATTLIGMPGELLVKGYSVMHGYWGDPLRTAEAIDPDGWLHTGDLATIDIEGRARIVGRIKDMIIRGGENIYPAEVKGFLHTHPDIVEVAVFGVTQDHFGEEVCAWIQAARPMTAEDVRAYCRERIAHHKIPVHVRFVDVFPMTVTGKVKKFEMQDEMRRMLGRAGQPGPDLSRRMPGRTGAYASTSMKERH